MAKKQETVSKDNKTESEPKSKGRLGIISLCIAILALIVSFIGSIIEPIILHRKNEELTREMQTIQENFEQSQKEQAAIPILRIADNSTSQKQMKIYEPYREPHSIQNSNGSITHESYFTIRNFSFENLSNNIAYINHIEYGGEAFELNNNELTTTQGEIITFSNDNLFIGSGYELEFYIIVKTIYQKYYSYRCSIYPDGKDGETYCYSVKSIGLPIEYNIENEIYKNRYIHVKIDIYPDHIIF